MKKDAEMKVTVDGTEIEQAVEAAADTAVEEKLMEEVNGMEDIVYVNEINFWTDHGTKVAGTAGLLATLATGFTAGFFTGKHVEAKKRALFMEEVKIHLALIEAFDQGEEQLEYKGITFDTATYEVNNPEDLYTVITEKFLNDKKIKTEEKIEWTNMALELSRAGVQARAKKIKTSNEIVGEHKDENTDK